MKFSELYITESSRVLLVVDIQPAYKKNIHFSIEEFVKFIAESDYSQILYLYNGPELGFEDDIEIQHWLHSETDYRYSEELPDIHFIEKMYAFFRNPMDAGEDHEDIKKVAKFMMAKGINDSRQLDEDDWKKLKVEDFGEDGITIPDFIDILKNHNNYDLVGGAEEECLKEVELCLQILGKSYKKLRKFIF